MQSSLSTTLGLLQDLNLTSASTVRARSGIAEKSRHPLPPMGAEEASKAVVRRSCVDEVSAPHMKSETDLLREDAASAWVDWRRELRAAESHYTGSHGSALPDLPGDTKDDAEADKGIGHVLSLLRGHASTSPPAPPVSETVDEAANEAEAEADPPLGWYEEETGVWRWFPGILLTCPVLAVCLRFLSPGFLADSVVELALENAGIGLSHASLLAQTLPRFQSLRHLLLHNNQLTSEAASMLAKAINMHGGLHLIDLEDNEVGAQGAAALSFCLQTNQSLSGINLNGNSIEDAGLYALAKALSTPRVHANGQRQTQGHNGGRQGSPSVGMQTPRDAVDAAQAVYHQFPLLQVAENGITSEGARFVASLCQANNHVISVNLANNKIGDKGAFYLAEMLAAPTSVRDLNVESNEITNHGVRALFNALQVGMCLYGKRGNSGKRAMQCVGLDPPPLPDCCSPRSSPRLVCDTLMFLCTQRTPQFRHVPTYHSCDHSCAVMYCRVLSCADMPGPTVTCNMQEQHRRRHSQLWYNTWSSRFPFAKSRYATNQLWDGETERHRALTVQLSVRSRWRETDLTYCTDHA